MSTFFKKIFKHFNLNDAKKHLNRYQNSKIDYAINRKVTLFHINNLIKDIKTNALSPIETNKIITTLFTGKMEKLFREKLLKALELLARPHDKHTEGSIEFLRTSNKNAPKMKR